MLNIPESVKNLFKTDGVRKNFRVRFPDGELPDITNSSIVQESVRFTESLCSQDVLKFGLTEASIIEFETVGIPNMYGMQIECFCEIDTSSLSASELASAGSGSYDGSFVLPADSDLGYGFYRVPYGVFRVESCPRNHEAMAHRQVTAYSKSFASLAKSLPSIPDQLSSANLMVDTAALLAQAEGTNLQSSSFGMYDYTGHNGRAPLYDSTGTAFYVSPAFYEDFQYRGELMPSALGIPAADFFSADFSYDPSEYYSFGKAVAGALTNSGFDFTYNSKKQSVFSSNEEALLNVLPWLFFPVVCGASGYPYGGVAHWQKAEPGKLHPLLHCGSSNSKYAFFDSTKGSEADFISGLTRIQPGIAGKTATHVRIRRADDIYQEEYARAAFTSPMQIPQMSLDENSLKAYTLISRSSHKLNIPNDGSTFPVAIQSELGGSLKVLQKYSFSLDRAALLDGYLEWSAYFGKIGRNGELGHFRLSNATPVELSPSDYSGFWLDEYDIESIGAVKYAYEKEKEGRQEVLFRFGSGASVYDMTDNAALKLLNGAAPKTIESLLRSAFVPHLGAVNFTPIDLNMKGLPYIEDGDFLSVTAQDGAVVRSFNLRHEISGTQVLNATVTSVAGEIIESEQF